MQVEIINAGGSITVCRLERSCLSEFFITALPAPDAGLRLLIHAGTQSVREHRASVVKMDVFGSNEAFDECIDAVERELGRVEWPVTFIDGGSCSGGRIAGIQIHAVSGVPVETVFAGDRPTGRVFEDAFIRTCLMGDVRAKDPSAKREEQVRQTLECLEAGLASTGMAMSNLVRTWFFNRNILDWYAEFNSVRSRFYRQRHVFDGLLPASTGIGADNPGHYALVASAMAIKAKAPGVSTRGVPSPLQCPAADYGSSFSRAVEVATPGCRHLIVSGTASIDPGGKTVHASSTDDQISLTLRVVEAILESRGMGFQDVTRAVAYFKRVKDAAVLTGHIDRHGLQASRILVARSDICRNDLLFEIEIDAVSTSTHF